MSLPLCVLHIRMYVTVPDQVLSTGVKLFHGTDLVWVEEENKCEREDEKQNE